MNRQQRRMAQKKGLPVAHEPVFNMKQSDIKKIKQEASEKAVFQSTHPSWGATKCST